MTYVSPSPDPHMQDEEQQWARIVATGNVARGMALVYVQKLCTAFHEYGPAHEAGILKSDALPFVKQRLLARLDYVFAVCEKNGIASLGGLDDLQSLRAKVEAASRLDELLGMTEEVHQVNHRICDALAASE